MIPANNSSTSVLLGSVPSTALMPLFCVVSAAKVHFLLFGLTGRGGCGASDCKGDFFLTNLAGMSFKLREQCWNGNSLLRWCKQHGPASPPSLVAASASFFQSA